MSRKRELEALMEVLTIGIGREYQAAEFYRMAAKNSADEESQKFFSEMEKWELGHMDLLTKSLEKARDEMKEIGKRKDS